MRRRSSISWNPCGSAGIAGARKERKAKTAAPSSAPTAIPPRPATAIKATRNQCREDEGTQGLMSGDIIIYGLGDRSLASIFVTVRGQHQRACCTLSYPRYSKTPDGAVSSRRIRRWSPEKPRGKGLDRRMRTESDRLRGGGGGRMRAGAPTGRHSSRLQACRERCWQLDRHETRDHRAALSGPAAHCLYLGAGY